LSFPFFLCIFPSRGTHTPSLAHSTPLRAKDFIVPFVYIIDARRGVPIYFHVGYISLEDEQP